MITEKYLRLFVFVTEHRLNAALLKFASFELLASSRLANLVRDEEDGSTGLVKNKRKQTLIKTCEREVAA